MTPDDILPPWGYQVDRIDIEQISVGLDAHGNEVFMSGDAVIVRFIPIPGDQAGPEDTEETK